MIKIINESRKTFTDKDDYEIIVSANKRTTGCTITCFDNNGNPNSYYLEKLYKDLMTQVVHLDQINGILEVSAPFNKVIQLVQNINGVSEMNESVYKIEDESDENTSEVGQILAQGDLSDYAEGVDLDAAKEPTIDYTDPKYQKVLEYLNSHGYPGSKFLGRSGYYIPQNTSYADIIIDDIATECSILTKQYRLNPASATELMGELTKLIPIVDDINAILADATNNDTKDRHVNESALTDSKIIELGNQNFGKPGTYILYRNGEHQTKRGFISFAADKAVADRYSKNGRQTEKFAVTIKNPYVVENANI